MVFTKSVLFSFDTYIESVIAFCETLNDYEVRWGNGYLVIRYN